MPEQGDQGLRGMTPPSSLEAEISVLGAMLQDSSVVLRAMESLKAEDVSVRMSGSGDISLHCNGAGYIDANLSGSGDLNLSGSARSVISNTSGSGRVRSGNLTIIRE